jgi:hypothetical protein
LVMIKGRANTSFLIVQRKVPGVAQVFVMTAKDWNRGRNIARKHAMDMAAAMGIELLTEEQYQELQKFGDFDTKTSSWVKTPLILENLAAPSIVIAATAVSSWATTVRSLTMPPGRSVAG